MLESGLAVSPVKQERRRRRSAEERRAIVEETLSGGTSVARVAQKYGVNANQVFQWRRLYYNGALGARPAGETKLLPVRLVEDAAKPAVSTGSIHIEFPGEVRVSLEGKVDPAIVHLVLQSLRA